MEYKCKCGSELFYVHDKGPHKGLYCIKCDKWLAWIKKDIETDLKKQGKIKTKTSIVEEVAKVVPIIQDGAAVDNVTIDAFMNVGNNESNLGLKGRTELTNKIIETEGCEICKGDKLRDTFCGGNMQLLKGSLIIHKPDGTINYQFGASVRYCPHCGRSIE